ncbi:MAG: hypothetical protein M3P51_15945, partial [Chloroflexota bacterium]|nr:hypothetical protein [Chloroflexota bacterium]
KIFADRYALKDEDGIAVEEYPEQMWARGAKGIATVELPEKQEEWSERFYDALSGFKFVPGGRILSGAGTPHEVTWFNCFVLESPEDSVEGIFHNIEKGAEIMRRSGGVGVNLSSLRPRGAYIKTVNGTSSGPCAWAILYSDMTGKVIQQGGSRRGAAMLMLDDDHPDIEEFVEYKRKNPGHIDHANLSVAVSDAFMEAVKKDQPWELKWDGKGGPIRRTVRARDLWRKIAESAHAYAEPGVVFMDRYNKRSNTWYFEDIRCVNPCFIGSTRVATDHGLLTMQELFDSQVAVTVATDTRVANLQAQAVNDSAPAQQYGVTARRATPVVRTGQQVPVLRLDTKHGYSVTATPNHKFLTPDGWVELRDLLPGDGLYLQSGEGGWSKDLALPKIDYNRKVFRRVRTGVARGEISPPGSWSALLGQMLGWLTGDGWLSRSGSDTVAGFLFLDTESATQAAFRDAIRSWFGVNGNLQHRPTVQLLTYRGAVARFFEDLGVKAVKAGEKRVPESLWRAPREAVIGFLQGLFTADATIVDHGSKDQKTCEVRLDSVSRELLRDVQQLLLNLGIVTRLREGRVAGLRMLPAGGGSERLYACASQYHLSIAKENLTRFRQEVGFLVPEKNTRIESYLRAKVRGPYRERFLTEVVAVVPTGPADVFDLTEPATHSLIAGGIVGHNCGEQGLPAWGVCNLGAINLAAFVRGYDPHTPGSAEFDFTGLEETARVAVRFLDNVIDATNYPFAENREAQQNGARRTGIGTMGIADVLVMMGLRYGSEEALPLVERIYRAIRNAAYDESAEIAAEKGPFPKFDAEKYLQGEFIRELPDELRAKIARHGIRNAVLLTQAPTGTTSSLAGVNSGIEPVFAFVTKRTDRLGEHLLYHPLAQEWKDANPDQPLPEYFVASGDLTPEEHVRMQALFQAYTCASISKCVTADTILFTEHGMSRIGSYTPEGAVANSFSPLSLSVAGENGVVRSDEFYYGGMRPVRRLHTRAGITLGGTHNHRVRRFNPETGETEWTYLANLKVGDLLPLAVGTHVYGNRRELPEIYGAPFYYERQPGHKHFEVPKRIDRRLARWLGYLTAEGHLTPNSVIFTQESGAVADDFTRLTEQVFGLTITPTQDQRREDTWAYRIHSQELVAFLRYLGYQDRAPRKTIPSCVAAAGREVQQEFLRGLTLDGFVSGHGRVVVLTTVSAELARETQVMLLN